MSGIRTSETASKSQNSLSLKGGEGSPPCLNCMRIDTYSNDRKIREKNRNPKLHGGLCGISMWSIPFGDPLLNRSRDRRKRGTTVQYVLRQGTPCSELPRRFLGKVSLLMYSTARYACFIAPAFITLPPPEAFFTPQIHIIDTVHSFMCSTPNMSYSQYSWASQTPFVLCMANPIRRVLVLEGPSLD